MSKWESLPLGKLCEVTAGGTPSRTNPVYFGGGIPWVKIGDMLQGRITSTEETISRKDWKTVQPNYFLWVLYLSQSLLPLVVQQY